MKAVRHIFFDLDNTLWNFSQNSAEVLHEIHNRFALDRLGITSAEAFSERYHVHNEMAWKAYREGRVDQQTLRWERYWRTLADFGHNDRKLAIDLSVAYLDTLAAKQGLMPGARDLLQTLHGKYTMHIVTNGFEETQRNKLRNSRLAPFFESVTTAESAGVAKPDPRIFKQALAAVGARGAESLYVGDHLEVDGGALRAGMHFAWYNPHPRPDLHSALAEGTELRHLDELPGLLNS